MLGCRQVKLATSGPVMLRMNAVGLTKIRRTKFRSHGSGYVQVVGTLIKLEVQSVNLLLVFIYSLRCF